MTGMNLINLLPAPPLDGSRALGPSLAKIHPTLERAALILVGVVAILWSLSRRDMMFGAFVAYGLYFALRKRYLRPVVWKLTNAEWLKALADLRRKGVEIVQGPLIHGPEGGDGPGRNMGGSGSRSFYFLDPDGNRLEIYADMMKVPAGEQFPRAEYAEVFNK